jgi:hypothetical protein
VMTHEMLAGQRPPWKAPLKLGVGQLTTTVYEFAAMKESLKNLSSLVSFPRFTTVGLRN